MCLFLGSHQGYECFREVSSWEPARLLQIFMMWNRNAAMNVMEKYTIDEGEGITEKNTNLRVVLIFPFIGPLILWPNNVENSLVEGYHSRPAESHNKIPCQCIVSFMSIRHSFEKLELMMNCCMLPFARSWASVQNEIASSIISGEIFQKIWCAGHPHCDLLFMWIDIQ